MTVYFHQSEKSLEEEISVVKAMSSDLAYMLHHINKEGKSYFSLESKSDTKFVN
jgi:hypothetical protein